jgi:hypothetical protein
MELDAVTLNNCRNNKLTSLLVTSGGRNLKLQLNVVAYHAKYVLQAPVYDQIYVTVKSPKPALRETLYSALKLAIK